MLVLRDPADAASIQELEVLQSRAIRIVKSIKGRHGITDGRTALGLQEQKDRRKFHRFALMTEILLEDEKHAVLSSAYSEIVNSRNQISMTACAVAKGEPISVYAKSHAYYNSFLPKTIRNLSIGPQH